MDMSTILITLHFILVVITILRVMLRLHREPAARIAWIAVIASLPVLGIVAYIILGEVNLGEAHTKRMRTVLEDLPEMAQPEPLSSRYYQAKIPQKYAHLFKLGHSISNFKPMGGNVAALMENSDAMIDTLVADIDLAESHVHLLFYIWLPDKNGCKVVEALKRAAKRGIACRVMVDNLGSRDIIGSEHWQGMRNAGVKVAVLLPIGNLLLKALKGRIDLRNHRKIVVIDDSITYCGSQNCADAAFLPKAKFAPWVDAVLRLKGPVARQNQHLFVSDWMVATDEDISDLLRLPISVPTSGFTAQIIGTGPTDRHLAMSQMFVALIASARESLTITTPYFVPNEPIQSALQSAAYRGVKTKIIFPAKNDSWIVQAASRSYYRELLEAGVEIYEFSGGLLHTKSMVIDGEFSMIGSANLDRRSFDLNYENNILISDTQVVANIAERQQHYLSQSAGVDLKTVDAWSVRRQLWNNTIAVLGPIL